ncbi:conserved hypothetical protein [Methylocella silvestris BL2]|uniref:MxaD protein n=1 Tax=Methylocella silvestris (strain DSM 15510 / CIP 108128 / LMG 27833 / NCIMB 13906 / BL2) TaxID=395965 RepID=B8EM78_METSB|nr:SRPBCC family protein [Methylocella silvestris]ACK51467.1 conserved hypothetical protein [Methylocella silvestris BL2]
MPKALLYAAGFATAAAAPALALTVTKSTEIPAAPAKVWAAVGDFCGIADWHPAIAKCELSSKNGRPIRTLTLKDGGVLVEELIKRDDKAMAYSYAILESPLPVAAYRSTIEVKPKGSGSLLTWTGTFKKARGSDNAKAQDSIAGIYDAGLKGVADKAK